MGTAVMPSRDTPPVFQSAECIFNRMPPLVQRLIKGKYSVSGSSGGCGLSSPGFRRFPQPTRVITSVCQKRTGIGNKALENGRTPVAADLPFSQQKRDRTPMPGHKQYGVWNSDILLFVLQDVENLLFEQACRRVVSLEMDGVDHQGSIKRCFICQSNESLIENTESAPPDKAIVQGFVGAVLVRSIFPLKSVPDDADNAADDTPVIHTGSTVRTGKERFDTLQLTFGKIKQRTHGTPPCLLHPLFSFP